MARNDWYVASESFVTHVDGVPTTISRGVTLATEESDLYRRFPQFFERAEAHYGGGVESATQAPGEKRSGKDD